MKIASSLKQALTLGLIALSFTTQAAIIDHGTYISDTNTGLDWLKLTNTSNRSFNDVSSKLGVGQEFESWSYASGSQFEALVIGETAIPMSCSNGVNFCGWSEANNGKMANLINLIGDTWELYKLGTQTTAYTGFAYGILADMDTSTTRPKHFLALIEDNEDDPLSISNDKIATHYTLANDTSPYGIFSGSFLVRPSTTTVPIPTAAWFMASGLLGLISVKRRKNNRKF
jgi:hypothetical protein